jgi:membrane-associated phospholipid phosphatase
MPLPSIARRALAGAAGLLVLLVVEWYLVFHVRAIEHLDATAYYGFLGLSTRPHVSAVALRVANLCNPVPYVFLAAVPVLVALLRRRPLVAGAILLILVGANLSTALLKPLLAAVRPDGLPVWQVFPGSWPSGHGTASMSLALCAVLAAPRRWRPYVAALGAAFAIAVCYSFLTLGWHYPSDAFAGLLVASIWTLFGIALVSILDARRTTGVERRTPAPAVGRALMPSVLAAGAFVLIAAIIVLLRPEGVAAYIGGHHAFLAGAAALAAAALSLPAGVMLTMRR